MSYVKFTQFMSAKADQWRISLDRIKFPTEEQYNLLSDEDKGLMEDLVLEDIEHEGMLNTL